MPDDALNPWGISDRAAALHRRLEAEAPHYRT